MDNNLEMGLLYFVMSSQGFNHDQEQKASFFHRTPDSFIVFGCNNKSESENGRALHKIPLFAIIARSEREEGKNMN